MKRILILFLLVCSVASAGGPNIGGGGGSVSGSVTVASIDQLDSIAPATQTGRVLVATSAQTLLSTIASFSIPCLVEIQAHGKVYFDPSSVATSAVILHQYLSAGDFRTIKPTIATYDLYFQADPAGSAATVAVTIHPLQ